MVKKPDRGWGAVLLAFGSNLWVSSLVARLTEFRHAPWYVTSILYGTMWGGVWVTLLGIDRWRPPRQEDAK